MTGDLMEREGHELVNAWTTAGEWIGMFYSADAAREWLRAHGHDANACEVSTRSMRQDQTNN
jgi:hypothetical protein